MAAPQLANFCVERLRAAVLFQVTSRCNPRGRFIAIGEWSLG
jgi:hypothetical protein